MQKGGPGKRVLNPGEGQRAESPAKRVLVTPEKRRHRSTLRFDELSQRFALRHSFNEPSEHGVCLKYVLTKFCILCSCKFLDSDNRAYFHGVGPRGVFIWFVSS